MERRFSRTPLFRAIIASVVLFVMATIAFSLFRYLDRVFWDDTTPEAVQTAGEPRLLPPHLNHTVPLNEGIQLPVPPKKNVQVPEKTITSKNPEAATARHNLATVLKRNADRGMFTINLSSGHERTLYAFLDPACPNCRLLEPALKRLASDFNVVIYPVSVIGGEESTDRVAPLLCEKDAQKGTVAKLAMRQPFVLFKGLTFQKLCLPGAFRPGDHHNKMLRPGLCVVHASPQYL